MKRFIGLTAQIQLLAGGALPTRVPLHPFGQFTGNRINFVFDGQSLEAVQRQLSERGTPWVLDLQHSTVRLEEGKVDRAPAYGWVRGVEVVDNYVYGLVEWTELGSREMEGGAYGFISPVLLYDEKTGRVLGYHSHAVTNRPGTINQRQIGLTAQEESMNLRELLGLPETATDAEVNAAMAALQARAAFGNLVMEALGLTSPELTAETRTRVISLAASEGAVQEIRQLRTQLEADRTQRQADAVAELVESAVADGRVLEPDRAKWERLARVDLAGTQAALAAMQPIVPTQAIVPNATKTGKLSQEDGLVSGLLGLSEADLKQYGGE
jgi:phage I-like protein